MFVASIFGRKPPLSAFAGVRLRLIASADPENDSAPITVLFGRAPGEGVSTVAARLAEAICSGAAAPCLLVGDATTIGRSGLAASTTTAVLGPGHLGDTTAASAVVEASRVPGLRLLALDDAAAAHMLVHRHFRDALRNAGQGCSRIIVDAGSLATEAPIHWARLADDMLMVIDMQRTNQSMLQRLKKELDDAGVRLTGCILNKRRLDIPAFIYKYL